MLSTVTPSLAAARALKVRTEVAQTGVSMLGKMLSTLVPAKSEICTSLRLLSVSVAAGADAPTAGSSPERGRTLPRRVTVAIGGSS